VYSKADVNLFYKAKYHKFYSMEDKELPKAKAENDPNLALQPFKEVNSRSTFYKNT
jgi:hypothetical protein